MAQSHPFRGLAAVSGFLSQLRISAYCQGFMNRVFIARRWRTLFNDLRSELANFQLLSGTWCARLSSILGVLEGNFFIDFVFPLV